MQINCWKNQLVGVGPLDISPGLLLISAILGQLDVVANAEDKLIPQSHLKNFQPSGQGVIRDALVDEGGYAKTGQALMKIAASNNFSKGVLK